jgi:predicted MFS family arabinose efflux permease
VLGQALGWRWTFALMSALSIAVWAWSWLQLPALPARHERPQRGALQVAALPGVLPVLAAMFTFVLAHNLLYTYIAPFLGDGVPVGRALATFGVASLAGIALAGAGVDRHLRRLVLAGTAAFAVAGLALAWPQRPDALTYLACAVWGIAFGGAATLYQTALLRAAGDDGDVAQSLTVTGWNLAIAGGGGIGGVLLARWGQGTLPWALLALLLASLAIAGRARRHGFPR